MGRSVPQVVRVTPEEMIQAMRALSNERREAHKWYRSQVHTTADKEREYRKEKAKAWLRIDQGTVPERQALVDAETADLRYERDLAAGLEKAALEDVRGVRQDMSLLQTYMAYERGVAELHRFDEGAA